MLLLRVARQALKDHDEPQADQHKGADPDPGDIDGVAEVAGQRV